VKVFDIHCHFLPGLDDGPGSLEDAVALLHAAWEGGTRALVATPHLYAAYFPGPALEAIQETFAATLDALGRLARRPEFGFLADLDLYLGAEHYCDAPFLAALESGAVLPINDSRYLLVEFPPRLPEPAAHAGLIRILQAGYSPIIAHVERYAFVHERPDRLQRLVDMGCIVQVNAGSTVGSRFSAGRRLTHSLLQRGLVHVLASDGHDAETRPPNLGPPAVPLTRAFSHAAVEAWTWDNPSRIVADLNL
jgi:protein-tyrosine phosphatase